jgi:Leucine-rich repeat (LRR) protein
LKTLDFPNNKIEVLPDDIGALTQLDFLSFKSNKLKKMPNTISALEYLTAFDLEYNPIDAVEATQIKDSLPNCNVRISPTRQNGMMIGTNPNR